MKSNLEEKKSPINILKRINKCLDSNRRKKVLFVFFLSVFSSLSESISIALLVPFVSFFINPETYLFNEYFKSVLVFFNLEGKKDILGFVAFSFIFIVLISNIIRLLYIKNSNRLSDEITSDFRIKIFNFLINQDYKYYFKHGTNEIMSNLSQKTGSFTVVVFAAMNIINALLVSFAVVFVLTLNEPIYTPIIIFTIILFFLIVYKIKSKSVYKKGQNVNLNQNIIIDTFENTVGYLQEVLIYNLKKFFLNTLIKVSKETAKSSSDIRTIGMFPRIYLETFVIIFVVLLIYFSNFAERSLTANISYLAILAFGAQKCLPLINSIYNLSISFKAAIPTVSSFLEILEKDKKDFIIKEENYKSLNFDSDISLENITFRYNENTPFILKNLSLKIKKGEKIVIKGRTGSGKSTLINLISGLIEPVSGNVIIDGIKINSSNKQNWQKNLAIVPQSVFLNDATVLENIAIGVDYNNIDLSWVKKCAELACINEFVENLPNKYEENVGEKGIKLSGGQKQRLAIARALYRNSKVILLDEPTNALDIKTEELVLNKINNISKDITIIMISHSDNSLKFFDRIFDLDKIS